MARKSGIGVGYQVGHLVVEEASDERFSGYKMWRCRCDCGGEILLDTRCLQRGTVTDCGCRTRVKPGQRDLTGRRFGRLVCLEPTKDRGKSGCIIWRCRCDCGSECLTESRYLLSGGKKSCGCGYRQSAALVDNLKPCEGGSVTPPGVNCERKISSNTSGHTGVYWNKQSGKWVAQITFKRKTYYLGSYERIEDAVKARRRGEERPEEFIQGDDTSVAGRWKKES